MSVHEVAAVGFDTEAEAYERARPSYPPDAVAWLVDALRLGARLASSSTSPRAPGKLTRLLVPSGASLVAVEPVDGMRAQLAARAPRRRRARGGGRGAPVRATRRSTPSPSRRRSTGSTPSARSPSSTGCSDPAVGSALIWNARDRSVPWVDAVWAIMDRVEKRAPWRELGEHRTSVDALGAAVVRAARTRPPSATSRSRRPTRWSTACGA